MTETSYYNEFKRAEQSYMSLKDQYEKICRILFFPEDGDPFYNDLNKEDEVVEQQAWKLRRFYDENSF